MKGGFLKPAALLWLLGFAAADDVSAASASASVSVIDPVHRNIVALSSAITTVAYHRNLIPARKTPDFARELAAQQPVWVRGVSRMFTAAEIKRR